MSVLRCIANLLEKGKITEREARDAEAIYRGVLSDDLLNQPDRALQTLQTLADSYTPGDEPQNILYLTGAAYQALGRYDEAVEKMQAAVARGKPNSDLLCRLAEAELLAGRSREAAAAAGQALALQPQHRPSLELLERIDVAQQTQEERLLK